VYRLMKVRHCRMKIAR